MLKIRMTFVDDEEGNKELKNAIDKLSKEFDIVNQSDVYKGRGKSKYSNIYIDVRVK